MEAAFCEYAPQATPTSTYTIEDIVRHHLVVCSQGQRSEDISNFYCRSGNMAVGLYGSRSLKGKVKTKKAGLYLKFSPDLDSG
ncbi:MAG: hypothetical protein WB564_00185 [Dehalococcoidia bacterium]